MIWYVCFSCLDQKESLQVIWDCKCSFSQVADDNYKALQSFFAKFPNFTQNEFFIFGESYGGIYAPTLSLRVATGKAKINFKVRCCRKKRKSRKVQEVEVD